MMAESPDEAEKAWRRLLPDADYRLPMNLRAGDAARFWRYSEEAGAVIAERRRWMEAEPERYFGWVPDSAEPAAEAVAWLAAVTGQAFAGSAEAACGVEPDWAVLSGEATLGFPVLGGAVVFPSGWALEEKLGRPLAAVHAPVPGLETALGAQIGTFLARIAPGAAWERDNWGLSADPALNQHPSRPIRRMTAGATLAKTWLRLEQQFLTRLPQSGAILFGIRVTNHRLDQLVAEFPAVGPRLARALATMPDQLAAYKGLAPARLSLVGQLRVLSPEDSRET